MRSKRTLSIRLGRRFKVLLNTGQKETRCSDYTGDKEEIGNVFFFSLHQYTLVTKTISIMNTAPKLVQKQFMRLLRLAGTRLNSHFFHALIC